jgi:hypothetical protein
MERRVGDLHSEALAPLEAADKTVKSITNELDLRAIELLRARMPSLQVATCTES